MTLSDLFDLGLYGVVFLFFATAMVHLSGNSVVPNAHRSWDNSPALYRCVGAIEFVVTCFLIVPQLRIWGAMLGGLVVFWSVANLLKNNQLAWSIPAILVFVALLPISLVHR
jgi:hypothetical protein